MCRTCRQNCRGIRFDFQSKTFYHDYCKSSSYVKPDAVYFFNPSLHRPGFSGFDTWPKTLCAAMNVSAPIFVTSCTQKESSMDLALFRKVAGSDVEIIQATTTNPFASTRPERNFTTEDPEPIIFKNQNYFILQSPRDLIQL